MIRYKLFAEGLGIEYENSDDRDKFHDMLGNIIKYEHENGRPLLSVVVVNKDGYPGTGFYKVSREIKAMKPDDDEVFLL